MYDDTCPCGSGLERRRLFDARGIFCSSICDQCEDRVRAKYRPDVLSNSDYWHDEPLEDD